MNKTQNYDMNLPDGSDFYSVEHANENFSKIDTEIGSPEYEIQEDIKNLTPGEKLSVAISKIARVVSAFIEHRGDNVSHVSSEERSAWNSKASGTHKHVISQITDFPSSMPASDVSEWAKASSKPSYAWSEIGSKPSTFAPSSHTHTKSQITDFPSNIGTAISGNSFTLPSGLWVVFYTLGGSTTSFGIVAGYGTSIYGRYNSAGTSITASISGSTLTISASYLGTNSCKIFY